jgi:hypothetical protein
MNANRVGFALGLCLLLAGMGGRASAQFGDGEALMVTARTNPVAAYKQLGEAVGRRLPAATRQAIAREALRALAVKVEKDNDPFGTLRDIGDAQAAALGLDRAMLLPLERLHTMAHRRALLTALDDAHASAKAGKWSEAAGAARLWSERLGDRADRIRLAWLPNIAREQNKAVIEACDGLAGPARLMGAADTIQKALDGKPTAQTWVRLTAPGLSKKLGEQLEALYLLRRLRLLAEKNGLLASEATELTTTLTRLKGLGHDELVKKVSFGLAVKALIDGRTKEFEAMLPEKVPADQAAAALRDLKALALGEGKVTTWAGKAFVPLSGPLPGALLPLVPTGRRGAWKPPMKDAAADASTPVAEADALFLKVAEEARQQLKAERVKVEADAIKARDVLVSAQATIKKAEDTERKSLAGVEYRLGRRMRPDEKPLALSLLDAGKKADEAANSLQAQVGGEEAFLNDVKRRLKRALKAEEMAEAKRLRKQGRRASEVAELLEK